MRILTLLTLALCSVVTVAEEGPDKKLQAVVESDQRPVAERERDRYRNPYETLVFFGIEPDMRVVELYPGGGWYTAILAPYLAEGGQLVAAHFNLDRADAPSYYERLHNDYIERFSDSERYGDIEIVAFDPPDKVNLGEPGSADMVLTFRNIHSWMGNDQLDAVFSAVHRVLKDGGVFGVVGHRLPEGRAQDPDAESGYVKESVVIAAAGRAGFTLDAKSDINANPRDDADHANGVWTLPPGLRVPEGEDEHEYRMIGESDRFTLRFVK